MPSRVGAGWRRLAGVGVANKIGGMAVICGNGTALKNRAEGIDGGGNREIVGAN